MDGERMHGSAGVLPVATLVRDGADARPAQVAELLLAARAQAHMLGSAAVGGVRSAVGPGEDSGAALIDLISALEDVTAAAAALQARAVVELDRTRRAQEATVGTPAKRRGRGVAAEVGLAARTSLSKGSTLLGFGKALCLEMPHTLTALADGRLSRWKAMLLVKESACLPREDRVRLDADLCRDPGVLAGLGDRKVGDAARAWCARENAAAVVERRAKAEAERRVTLRPAPDTMAYLTALVPVAQGVAAFAALSKHADSARAVGDPRTRGQLMADALVAQITGQQEGAAPPVLVNLVMTDSALFTGGSEPGVLPGYGPVPAAVARELVDRASTGPGAWVRRLYLAPSSGALVAMDSRQRKAPKGLAEFIALRDGGTCRVAWCDAPARHLDHSIPHADGGATQEVKLQSTCEGHNYAKQAPGWMAGPRQGLGRARDPAPPPGRSSPPVDPSIERHTIVTRTPSGHRYVSVAPALPGALRQVRARRWWCRSGGGGLDDPARGAGAAESASTPEASPGEARMAELLAS